jgi:hypothetical protein
VWVLKFALLEIVTWRIRAVAGYAVDGNTDGEFLNKSTTHTNDEQGAWWQVDLGSRKKISKWIYTGLCGRFSKR